KGLDLDARFFVAESAALRTALPSLAEGGPPLIVSSNELPELMLRLSQSGAREHSSVEPLQFEKFSGGRFHWKVGTNNVVNYQTADAGERRVVLGAEIGLSATQSDWTPLEFVLVPWAELDSIRCEMELGIGLNPT